MSSTDSITKCPHCGKPIAATPAPPVDTCGDDPALDLAASWAMGAEVYPDTDTPAMPGRDADDKIVCPCCLRREVADPRMHCASCAHLKSNNLEAYQRVHSKARDAAGPDARQGALLKAIEDSVEAHPEGSQRAMDKIARHEARDASSPWIASSKPGDCCVVVSELRPGVAEYSYCEIVEATPDELRDFGIETDMIEVSRLARSMDPEADNPEALDPRDNTFRIDSPRQWEALEAAGWPADPIVAMKVIAGTGEAVEA